MQQEFAGIITLIQKSLDINVVHDKYVGCGTLHLMPH